MPIAAIGSSVLCTSPVDNDVDYLMKKISDTLKLKACQKQMYYGCRNRSTPYGVVLPHSQRKHVTRCGFVNTHSTSLKTHKNSSDKMNFKEDRRTPYDILQDLLRDGKLVQEAVRRVRVQRQSSDDMSGSCSSLASCCSDDTNNNTNVNIVTDEQDSLGKSEYSVIDTPIFNME